MPSYNCAICGTEPDEQKSHHTKHLKSKKHKDAKRILELELEKMAPEEIMEKYGKTDIAAIVASMETVVQQPEIVEQPKLTKTNKIVYEKTIDEINTTSQNETFKQKFLAFLNRQHNLLRGASVTGDEALDDILYCLLFCYLQDKISDTGDFDLANSEKACYKGTVQRKVKDYVKYLDIDYLLERTEELRVKEGTDSIVKCGKLLSKHPKTKGLMKDENFINCNDVSTLTKLFEECRQFANVENIFDNIDIIGIAYEYISTKHSGNGGTSKEMGQYFTERPLMFMCFQLIDETDLIDLGIDDDSTLGDEFCATFGFPLSAKTFLKNKFNVNIQDKNMYGVEFHERLSRFALMNAMFAMKNTKHITRGNSFITNVKPHLDFSVHNVPFGKSMTPKNIEKTYKDFLMENPDKGYPEFEDYIPFNTKKIDAILSSQVVLQKTKKMGLMIIKDGEETSGKSNDKYRKWFSENCVIKKIMKIPTGAFTCTGTKTVCIYFIKKEGQMTESIQFLQLSDDGNSITEICNVPMETMKKNHYSWDPNSYVVDEEMEKMMSVSTCKWKKLGDVCSMLPTTKHYTKIGNKEGKYRFYNSSQKDKLYLDDYEIFDESVIIGNGGELCVHYDKKFTASKHVTVIQASSSVLNKYMYYFILNNIETIKKQSTGGGIQWLNKEKIQNINIPIPPIGTQTDLVRILDDLADQKRLLLDRKSGIERQMRYYFETQIKKNDMNPVTLTYIFNIKNGNFNSNEMDNDGTIPFYSCIANNPAGFNSTYNMDYESYLLLVSSGGSQKNPCGDNVGLGKCYAVKGKTACRTNVYALIPKNTDENIEYIYYYLNIFRNITNSKAKFTTNLGVIGKDDIENINILTSTYEIQTQIVEYLDKLEGKKNNICEEINEIDVLMKDVITQSYS